MILILKSLDESFSMFWEVLWPLILGFSLSSIVQAVVSHKTLVQVLGGENAKSLSLAALFGIASSSCSYAAVALARSIYSKGASFTSAMVFELASTNLVIELGIILWVFLGWRFALAEWIGGAIMIIIIPLLFRFTLKRDLLHQAYQQTKKGLLGKMEGHAAMDMSLKADQPFWRKILSPNGFTAISHYFVMDLTSIWIDLVLGFLIAGALETFVPESFWQTFFLTNNPTWSIFIGPLIGPLIAIISFVCSVGNVPLAAVLWRGGISFGGVISFIFADLIILPILDIYRKYYGKKMMIYILITFYLAMFLAGLIVELLFSIFHLTPTNREIIFVNQGLQFNYTTYLNIIFLVIGLVLVWRFFKTGGVEMLKMMNMDSTEMSGHNHHHHH